MATGVLDRRDRWSGGFGVEVDGQAAPLGGLDAEELKQLVLDEGFVLLRNFACDVDDLQGLNDALFDRPLIYGGAREKVSDDDTVQTVDLGHDHLGLHVELGYVPVRPDLAVFHCIQPASDGGETTVGDGAAIHQRLRPSTRALLRDHRVRFDNIVREATWQRMFKTESQELIMSVVDSMPDTEAYFDDVGDLHIWYLTSALHERRNTTVFADSVHRFEAELEPEWNQGLKKTSSTLHEAELPEDVRTELRTICADVEQPIGWRPGDVAVLDNWSVLHGRTAFRDTNRRILASFGYASWARPTGA